MLTFTRESAEEELGAAEIALEELLDNAPIVDRSPLIALETVQSTEMAQLSGRQSAILQSKYQAHRAEIAELKVKHAQEISELQASNREARAALTSVHISTKSELTAELNSAKLQHSAKLRAARQRVKNAEIVLRQLAKVGR